MSLKKRYKSTINNYYYTIIKDIIEIIDRSENGVRRWYIDENDNLNYSLTTRSTYPNFLKFYFVKTPKHLRVHYCRVGTVPYLDGYFNGSPRDLRKMFVNALEGKLPRSPRMLYVFDLVLLGYFDYAEEYYKFDDMDFEEFPF